MQNPHPALSVQPPIAPSSTQALRRSLGVLLAVALAVFSAWWVSRATGLVASSERGYWLGVLGGLAMLALFSYPLRKRVRWMRHLGPTRLWFVAHMLLGLAGPWLILVHCSFRIGSLNAAVALVSMLVVAGSGVVGRYLYVQVHQGLSGQKTELGELRQALAAGQARTLSDLASVPAASARLLAFEQATLAGGWQPGASPWPMLQLAWRARRVQALVRADIARALQGQPRSPALRQRRQAWLRQSQQHLAQVLRVAHFASWERLFSLWHVLHLPFVYLMVVCALVHVVAVHAY